MPTTASSGLLSQTRTKRYQCYLFVRMGGDKIETRCRHYLYMHCWVTTLCTRCEEYLSPITLSKDLCVVKSLRRASRSAFIVQRKNNSAKIILLLILLFLLFPFLLENIIDISYFNDYFPFCTLQNTAGSSALYVFFLPVRSGKEYSVQCKR